MNKASPRNGHRNSSPSGSRAGPRRLRGQGQSRREEIYDDLLQETLSHSAQADERPLKRRKSRRDPSQVIIIDDTSSMDEGVIETKGKNVVVIDSSTEGDTDIEDAMEWDNVDLTTLPFSQDAAKNELTPSVREVTLATSPQKSMYVSPQY
jgi:hypothetical protein